MPTDDQDEIRAADNGRPPPQRSGYQKAGKALILLGLLAAIVPFACGLIADVLYHCCFEVPGRPPPLLEALAWAPILTLVTIPAALVAGIVGLILLIVGGKRGH